MKFLKKIIMLSLTFALILATVVKANPDPPDPPDPFPPGNDNWDLVEQLQREVAELTRQLEEARGNPNLPVPINPVVRITNPLLIEIEAGSTRTIEFTLENLTAHTANTVITTVDLRGATGISGSFTDRSFNIPSMGNRNTRTLSYQISVNENAEEDFHTIVFNHSFLNQQNRPFSEESRVIVRVISPTDRVTLRDIESSVASVSPGGNFDLRARIYNESNLAIRDVSLTITEGMASDGIFLRESTNVVSIANMRGGVSENISIGFSASQHARRGAYPLTLQLAFTDSRGDRHTRDYRFFVNVGASQRDLASEIIISEITYPSGNVNVGDLFEMSVTLRNTSEYTARNIRVDAAAGPGGEGAIVPRTTSIAQVQQLESGEERRLSFSFAPTTSSRSQNYVMGFTVSYETGREDAEGEDEIITFTQYQGVNVYNPEAEDDDDARTSTPRIIVSDFRSDPMIVQAGQEFDLDLTFLNTSNRVVRNIKIVLSVEEEVTTNQERRGSVFTPVGRSNTFFIDSIAPRGEVTEHIRYFTLPDAPPRNYIINVNFDYEDEENNPFEARESIGINVAQVTRFDTSEIFVPDFAQVWQPIFLNFEIYNTGRVTLSNLMIRIEGDAFNASQSSVFYGSLSPGAMDFYDNQVTPMEPGMQEFAVVITFEDDAGRQIEERRTFMIDVMGMPDFDDSMFERPMLPDAGEMVWDDNLQMWVPASSGPSTAVIVGTGLGGTAAVGGAAAYIIRHMRRKRSESMVDIDE